MGPYCFNRSVEAYGVPARSEQAQTAGGQCATIWQRFNKGAVSPVDQFSARHGARNPWTWDTCLARCDVRAPDRAR